MEISCWITAEGERKNEKLRKVGLLQTSSLNYLTVPVTTEVSVSLFI